MIRTILIAAVCSVIVSVATVFAFNKLTIVRGVTVTREEMQEELRYLGCYAKGFTIERMDLIPYGRCMCNDEQECYCYPI